MVAPLLAADFADDLWAGSFLSSGFQDGSYAHHASREPADLMLAQYSAPFTLALPAFRDPEDPRSFDDAAVHDDEIRKLARAIELIAGGRKGWGAVTIKLQGGREISAAAESCKGCPENTILRTRSHG